MRLRAAMVVWVTAVLTAPVAHCLELHEGFPAKQLMQKLNAENQKVVVMASQSIIIPEVKDIAILFTADQEGGTGYMLESDKGINEPGGTLHVAARFPEIHLNFSRVAPSALFAGTDPTIAAQQCAALIAAKKLGENTCKPLNEVMNARTQAGQRVLLWGLSETGAKIIVSGDVDSDGSPAQKDNGLGGLEFASRQGATFIASPFDMMTTSDDFTDLLSNRSK